MDRSFAYAVRLPSPLAIVSPGRLTRKIVLAGMLALALLVGAWMWLRDSPLLAVNRVQISGVRGYDAAAIESSLVAAARHMTTMDPHSGALMAAVAPYRVVREIHLSTSFPHGLRIRVVEQPPVAALTMNGTRTAVAADGVVLGPGFLSSSLPVIHGEPPSIGARRLSSASQLAELAVLGAAPETLLGWIVHVYVGRNGITVAMRNGLLLYFGDAARPHAKWLSAARVLADSSAAGASYVDVRLPERPAAGMGASAGSPTGAPAAGQVSASDPTAAALAATLANAVSGRSATAAGSTGAGNGATAEASGSTGEAGAAGTSAGPQSAAASPAVGSSTSSLPASTSSGAATPAGGEAQTSAGGSTPPTPGG